MATLAQELAVRVVADMSNFKTAMNEMPRAASRAGQETARAVQDAGRAQVRAAQDTARQLVEAQRGQGRSAVLAAQQQGREMVRAAQDSARAQVEAAKAAERQVSETLEARRKAVEGLFSGMKRVGDAMTIGVTLPLLAVARNAAQAATNLEESQNKVKVVFGQSTVAIEAWAMNTSRSLGISRREALESAGTFGNLFTSMGIGQKPAAEMSQTMVKLAGDLASFNNVPTKDALEAIRSALVGEQEPMRRFGVNISDATLKAEAMRLGLIKTTKDALEPQTKAVAAYSLMLQQTKNAQGDYERTANSAANQQRTLTARYEDAAAKLGQHLVPIKLRLLKVASDLLDIFNKLSPEAQEAWVKVGLAVAIAGPAIAAIGRIGSAVLGLAEAYKAVAAASAGAGLAGVPGAGPGVGGGLLATLAARRNLIGAGAGIGIAAAGQAADTPLSVVGGGIIGGAIAGGSLFGLPGAVVGAAVGGFGNMVLSTARARGEAAAAEARARAAADPRTGFVARAMAAKRAQAAAGGDGNAYPSAPPAGVGVASGAGDAARAAAEADKAAKAAARQAAAEEKRREQELAAHRARVAEITKGMNDDLFRLMKERQLGDAARFEVEARQRRQEYAENVKAGVDRGTAERLLNAQLSAIRQERSRYYQTETAEAKARIKAEEDAASKRKQLAAQEASLLEQAKGKLREAQMEHRLLTATTEAERIAIREYSTELSKLPPAVQQVINATIRQEEATRTLRTEQEKAADAAAAQGKAAEAQANVTRRLAEALADSRARFDEATGRVNPFQQKLAELNLATRDLTDEQKKMVQEIVRTDYYADAYRSGQRTGQGMVDGLRSQVDAMEQLRQQLSFGSSRPSAIAAPSSPNDWKSVTGGGLWNPYGEGRDQFGLINPVTFSSAAPSAASPSGSGGYAASTPAPRQGGGTMGGPGVTQNITIGTVQQASDLPTVIGAISSAATMSMHN